MRSFAKDLSLSLYLQNRRPPSCAKRAVSPHVSAGAKHRQELRAGKNQERLEFSKMNYELLKESYVRTSWRTNV